MERRYYVNEGTSIRCCDLEDGNQRVFLYDCKKCNKTVTLVREIELKQDFYCYRCTPEDWRMQS